MGNAVTLFYEISGARLASPVPLTTLGAPAPEGDGSAAVHVRFEAELPESARAMPLEVSIADDRDEPLVSVGRGVEGGVLCIHGAASFWASAAGTEVVCVPIGATPHAAVEQLLIDHVLPKVLQLSGRPALHASAVATSDGVIAFTGESGAGKSTLAASLARRAAAAGAAGDAALVSDDCLALSAAAGGIMVHPSYASLRLWPDSASAVAAGLPRTPASPRTEKLRVSLTAAAGPLPLRRVYVLEPGEGAAIAIERLRPQQALLALTHHLHRFDSRSQDYLRKELAVLETLARTVTVARLRFGHDYTGLPAVHAALDADLARR